MNVNGLNAPIERQRLSEWIKKQDPTVCCLQEIYFKYKDIYKIKANEWEKIYHANTNQKKAGVDILISDRADCRVRKVIRDKEGH